MSEIIDAFFVEARVGEQKRPAPTYNLRTKHDLIFGGRDGYIVEAEYVLGEMARFVADERREPPATMTFSLGISNIAWPTRALEQGLDLACALGLSFVEIAPFAVFGQWDDIDDEASRLREAIERRGLTCAALQGIVYNVHNVELFSSEDRAGGSLDISRLSQGFREFWVQRRVCTVRQNSVIRAIYRWKRRGQLQYAFCNPSPPYSLRTMRRSHLKQTLGATAVKIVTTTSEALELVKAVGQAGISLQIDTGTLFLSMKIRQCCYRPFL